MEVRFFITLSEEINDRKLNRPFLHDELLGWKLNQPFPEVEKHGWEPKATFLG